MLSIVKAKILSHPKASVFVAGHSIGGTLATFAAIDIKRILKLSKMIFYTNGSPRVGNHAFSDYAFGLFPNGCHKRITYYNDVVPHLAPVFFGFIHFRHEVWYKNEGYDFTYRVCYNAAGKPESNLCSN